MASPARVCPLPGAHQHFPTAGVHFMHSRSVVHLDIKPLNILVGRQWNDPPSAPARPFFIDFGLSSVYPNPKKVPFTVLRGSKEFMSPEVGVLLVGLLVCLVSFHACILMFSHFSSMYRELMFVLYWPAWTPCLSSTFIRPLSVDSLGFPCRCMQRPSAVVCSVTCGPSASLCSSCSLEVGPTLCACVAQPCRRSLCGICGCSVFICCFLCLPHRTPVDCSSIHCSRLRIRYPKQ